MRTDLKILLSTAALAALAAPLGAAAQTATPAPAADDLGVDFAEDEDLAEDDDDVPFLEDEEDDFPEDEIDIPGDDDRDA